MEVGRIEFKEYKIKNSWNGEYETVIIHKHRYTNGGNWAILLSCSDCPYATLTVNLPEYDIGSRKDIGENLAFVDTNNLKYAEEFIIDNNLGKFTGYYGQSGFCKYPLYDFNIDLIF